MSQPLATPRQELDGGRSVKQRRIPPLSLCLLCEERRGAGLCRARGEGRGGGGCWSGSQDAERCSIGKCTGDDGDGFPQKGAAGFYPSPSKLTVGGCGCPRAGTNRLSADPRAAPGWGGGPAQPLAFHLPQTKPCEGLGASEPLCAAGDECVTHGGLRPFSLCLCHAFFGSGVPRVSPGSSRHAVGWAVGLCPEVRWFSSLLWGRWPSCGLGCLRPHCKDFTPNLILGLEQDCKPLLAPHEGVFRCTATVPRGTGRALRWRYTGSAA